MIADADCRVSLLLRRGMPKQWAMGDLSCFSWAILGSGCSSVPSFKGQIYYVAEQTVPTWALVIRQVGRSVQLQGLGGQIGARLWRTGLVDVTYPSRFNLPGMTGDLCHSEGEDQAARVALFDPVSPYAPCGCIVEHTPPYSVCWLLAAGYYSSKQGNIHNLFRLDVARSCVKGEESAFHTTIACVSLSLCTDKESGPGAPAKLADWPRPTTAPPHEPTCSQHVALENCFPEAPTAPTSADKHDSMTK